MGTVIFSLVWKSKGIFSVALHSQYTDNAKSRVLQECLIERGRCRGNWKP